MFFHVFFPANLALRFHADPKADEKNQVCFRSIKHAWFETVLEVVNHCLEKNNLPVFVLKHLGFTFAIDTATKSRRLHPKGFPE